MYDFARAVSLTSALRYEQVDLLAGKSALTLNQLKKKVDFNLKVTGDEDGRFAAAFEAMLSENGYTVLKNQNAKYEFNAQINFSSVNRTEKTYEIHPFYSVEVLGNGKTLFSYTRKLEKSSGFDLNTAERRARLYAEKDIKTELKKEF